MMRPFVVAIAMIALWVPEGLSAVDDGASCDRACLQSVVTQYVEAMVAHDPARLPLSPAARLTENGATIPFGEGLWTGISAMGDYRFDYVDEQAGQIATHLNFVENGKPGLMSLRLKVVGGQIVEVETVVNRGARLADRMVPAEGLWSEIEAPATRLERSELIAVAESYLAGVAASNGRIVPFDEQTCVRLENGGVMAMTANDRPPQPGPDPQSTVPWLKFVASTMGMGCASQLDTGMYGFITSYNNARFPVVDVERQVVFGQWNFRRLGNVKGFTWQGVYTPFMDSTQFPNENLLGQAFKIRGGKIVRVQGVFLNANVYGAGTGWGPGRDGPVANRR